MPDFPVLLNTDRFIISPASPFCIGEALNALGLGISTAVWPTANKALYVPFSVQSPITVTQFFWENGGTLSGNVDVGIYDLGGKRLVSSGSVAQSGTSVIQSVDTTDLLLQAGAYYLAMAMDNGTGQIGRWSPSAAYGRALGLAEQATAFPLPATATFAALTVGAIPGVFGTLRSFV